ncbi:MAG: class I tRNA ligase family protein [Patescibacteria group bacterium]
MTTDFKNTVDNLKQSANEYFEKFEINEAVRKISEISSFGNDYIQKEEPWGKEKDLKDIEIVLNNLSYLLSVVIDLYSVVIPESCEKAINALNNREKIILFNKIIK